MRTEIINTSAVIDYIENHLTDRLNLETVSNAVRCSKYHLHRVFTKTAGLTIRSYAARRRLTEAAKLLVFSDTPIIEIALTAGYESQQAFTAVFKSMYKKSPNQYREAGFFYPLQLRYVLYEKAARADKKIDWQKKITEAQSDDISCWMDLVRLVINGFPHLDEKEHIEALRLYISKKQALIIKDGGMIVGAMAFNEETGSIDFLGVHPQYHNQPIAESFLQNAFGRLRQDIPLSITTFRSGDKADCGHRAALKKLGFAESELLVEFGYPTQKYTLNKKDFEANCYE